MGTALIALTTAGACVGGGGTTCTDIGAPRAVTFTVAPSDAEGVEAAEMELCQDDACEDYEFVFTEDTRAVAERCEEGTCAAEAEETGGLRAQVLIDDLTTGPADVRIELRGTDGEALSAHEAAAAPEMVYPNGPDCGAQGPQLGLEIEDGELRRS
ncbi:hypothetical protein [Nocardiopsis halophila]|uniref:hypothetical protein n=1 Tax=Nocardiopsis halophila TaxID=141692 RepID=UPI00035FB6EC|nr:hypothetical protein [Nocardiopsis halophila]